MRSALHVFAGTLLLTALPAQDSQPTRVEALTVPLQRDPPGDAGTVSVFRVVAAADGVPLAGARLQLVSHRQDPAASAVQPTGTLTGDVHGFLQVDAVQRRRVDGIAQYVLEAAGHGPTAAGAVWPRVVALGPSLDWPIDVRDVFDRPVAGAEVGLSLRVDAPRYVRVASTDAQGRAVLRAVEPTGLDLALDGEGRDLHVRAVGHAPLRTAAAWHPEEPHTVLRLDLEAPLHGRVLAPDGQPLRGALVSTEYLAETLYSRTDADGAYRLPAHAAGADVRIELSSRGSEFVYVPPAVVRPFDIVLPGPGSVRTAEPATLRVVVRDAVTQAPVEGAVIAASCTGWLPWYRRNLWVAEDEVVTAAEVRTDAQGRCELSLPAGALGVRVRPAADDSSTAPPRHEAALHDLVTRLDGPNQLVVDLVPRASAAVRIGSGVRRAWLVTRSGRHALEPAADAADPVHVPVPAHEPFAFHIDTEDEPSARVFGFSAPPTQPVELQPWPPTRVVAQVVGAEGTPIPVRARLAPRSERQPPPADLPPLPMPAFGRGKVELAAVSVGTAWLHVAPLDAHHRPTVVRVVLPERSDEARLDVGTITLPSRAVPRLRVLRADGTPVSGTLTLRRPGVSMRGALAADGGWDGLWPERGDAVVCALAADAVAKDTDAAATKVATLPLRARLRGDGPWTLQPGTGVVQFDLRDDRGFRLHEGVLFVAGDAFDVHDVFALRGVPSEPLEFYVGASGCDGARVTLQLAPGEVRTVAVVLRRRA